MIYHINVSSVLRKTVCDLYTNLVTRPTGVAVRQAIERVCREAGYEPPVICTPEELMDDERA